MATDLVQRAAAICGLDNPNSDQLSEWIIGRGVSVTVESTVTMQWSAEMLVHDRHYSSTAEYRTLLEALAAAVVEVDRIEREAAR